MSYYNEITQKVDSLIDENSIHNMNEMLMHLSHDDQLNQDQRFEQQQRLREAIFAHHNV
ncbi:DUF2526 family protein [Providencia sp. Me31A]|uniref:DUF2526 family protein n=1 Tax=Providencia sp. Me31A TaxID=3392637 RepID=UPI003D2C1F18